MFISNSPRESCELLLIFIYLFIENPRAMCERLLIVVCLFQTHAQGAKFYSLLFISKPRTMRELLLIGVSLFIELERVPRSGQNE